MRLSLPAFLIKIVLIFTWLVYPLIVLVMVYLMRKNARIGIGTAYMFHVIFHTHQHTGADREEVRAAGKQMSRIIAHDAYATGSKIYLMQYWILSTHLGLSQTMYRLSQVPTRTPAGPQTNCRGWQGSGTGYGPVSENVLGADWEYPSEQRTCCAASFGVELE
jgi:hypothetical protein